MKSGGRAAGDVADDVAEVDWVEEEAAVSFARRSLRASTASSAECSFPADDVDAPAAVGVASPGAAEGAQRAVAGGGMAPRRDSIAAMRERMVVRWPGAQSHLAEVWRGGVSGGISVLAREIQGERERERENRNSQLIDWAHLDCGARGLFCGDADDG